MAARAPRPCRKPACGQLSRDGTGLCEGHKAAYKPASGWERTKRAPRHIRYGKHWPKLRERILKRDRYLCQTCLAEGIATPGRTVDHIIPKSQGGGDDERNLAVICEPHHKVKTAKESAYQRSLGSKAV